MAPTATNGTTTPDEDTKRGPCSHHFEMLKTAQYTAYRHYSRPTALPHHIPTPNPAIPSHSILLPSSNVSSTSNSKPNSKSPSNSSSSENLRKQKCKSWRSVGNRENRPPKQEMVHFKGLLSGKRRFGDFRRVLHTGVWSQVVGMEIPVGGEMGEEVVKVDVILLVTSGRGLATIANTDQIIEAGDLVVVPAGTQHQVVTVGDEALELVVVYSPAEHDPMTVHRTREEAEVEEDEERDEAPEWCRRGV